MKLAKKFEIPIRCVLFTASAKLCEHNDTVRALNDIVGDVYNLEKHMWQLIVIAVGWDAELNIETTSVPLLF